MIPLRTQAERHWTPRDLFRGGEQGAWYDPSDLSTLFQDAAGTTPVTAVEQPVGLMLDKSGRGNHAVQSVNTDYRPLLKQDENGNYYLLFDGTNDAMATSAIDFTATDKMTVWAGVRKLSDAAQGTICCLGTFGSSGNFALSAPSSAGESSYRGYIRTNSVNIFATSYGYVAPITNTLVFTSSISTDLTRLYVNNHLAANITTDHQLGVFTNYPLLIGIKSGSADPFNGRLYGLIVRGAQSTLAQIQSAERWLNRKTRAY